MNLGLIGGILLLLLIAAGIIAFIAIRSKDMLYPIIPLLMPSALKPLEPSGIYAPGPVITDPSTGLEYPLTNLTPGMTDPTGLQYPLTNLTPGMIDPIGLQYPLTGLSPGMTTPLELQYPLTNLTPADTKPIGLDPNTNVIPWCKFCGNVNQQGGMVQFCPKGVLPTSATRKIPAGTASIISNYRLTSDPVKPDYNYKGQGYWWRQGATGCSG